MQKQVLLALELIIDRIGSDDPDYKWLVIGSTSLLIHSIEVKIKDLDILANEKAFKAICRILSKYLIQEEVFEKNDLFEASKCIFNIDGLQIELIRDFKVFQQGYWEDKNFLLENFELVYYRGLAIPVSSLTELLKAYSKIAREKDLEKVRLIETRMKELQLN